MEHKTVLFVEQSKNGELGRRLWKLMKRIAPILGFGVKIVERNGASLKSKFPQASLWEGAHCDHPTTGSRNNLAPDIRKYMTKGDKEDDNRRSKDDNDDL